jgi:hypothetical protein
MSFHLAPASLVNSADPLPRRYGLRPTSSASPSGRGITLICLFLGRFFRGFLRSLFLATHFLFALGE